VKWLIILLGFLLFLVACKKEPMELPVEESQIEDTVKVNPEWTDSCSYTHLFACSYHVRKGVWVEVQDSITNVFQHPDTFWFHEVDSLRWRQGGLTAAGIDTIYNLHYYFNWEIFHVEDGAGSYYNKDTNYDYGTDTFSIVWHRDYQLSGKPLIVDYYRLE